MAEEYKHIQLQKGDTSMSPNLGVYYIDFTDSLIHYESDFYGDKDKDGIPMTGTGENALYYPINIAQYGLLLHALWLNNKDENALAKMRSCVKVIDQLKTEEEKYCYWIHSTNNERFGLKPGWTSAMAQGQCISLYLRYYQVSGEEEYLERAIKAYNYLEVPVEEGGVRAYDEEGNLWLEEYPSPNKPSCVLNGFIYAMWGLYDLYRVTKNEKVKEDIDSCVLTLKNTLHKYDVGYWSLYDQRTKELVRYYYQKNVHVPQMEVMYDLTGEEIFKTYYKKWKKTVTPFHYALVFVMYRVRPRWFKLKKLLGGKK